MSKDKIVHFVGFATTLPFEDFNPLWESCLKRLNVSSQKVILDETIQEQKGTFKYISQHEHSSADFKFAFMKESTRANFPNQKVRVVQAGGYMAVQFQPFPTKTKGMVKIIAFTSQGDNELDFYQQQSFLQLNVYEAYFENCKYSHVLEYLVNEKDAPALFTELKTRPGIEVALYKECRTSSLSLKASVI